MKGLAVQGRAKPRMVKRLRARTCSWLPGRGSSYDRRISPEHEAVVFVMPGVLPATLRVLFRATAS